jgi:hypothetical protein
LDAGHLDPVAEAGFDKWLDADHRVVAPRPEHGSSGAIEAERFERPGDRIDKPHVCDALARVDRRSASSPRGQ